MKIINSAEMQAFFERCLENINDDSINEYIGIIVEPNEEVAVQEELAEIGVHEFQADRSKWPSLYISVDEYQKTPYNMNIHLDKINGDGFEYNEDIMPAYELFNVDVVQPDPNRELNDSLILRAFDKPYKTVILKQDGEYWMTDTPAEANTINPCAKKAHGNVLTFGLGIGYFVYMALLNPNVDSVTIVERSPSVINMFKKYLLPQFPNDKKIEIIEGDAFDYFNKEFLNKFDYTFVDIWKSSDDGFEIIQKMLEKYLPPLETIDFWIEETCFEFLTSMICIYFNYVANGQTIVHNDPFYMNIYRKIETYFDCIDDTVTDVDTLKDYMYSKKVLREIISIHK